MKVMDAYWTEDGNIIYIECECGVKFFWPTWIMLAECRNCGNAEIWDGADCSGNHILSSYKTSELCLVNK